MLMAPGARSKFGAPMFEPELFRKKICCIEGSACDIVGTFLYPTVIGRPHSDLAPGGMCPTCSPHYARADETRTPKQCTNNYGSWSPIYRSIE